MLRSRRFWSQYLAALMLLGAVQLHADAEPINSLVTQAGDVYFPDLPWHGTQVHLDSAVAISRPFCPVCVHQLQTSGAHGRLAIAVVPATRIVGPVRGTASRRSDGSSRVSSARGPPALA